MKLLRDIKSMYLSGSYLLRIIYINSGIFLLVAILKMIGFLVQSPEIPQDVIRFLAAPAAPAELARRPWTPFTYMFLHEGFLHLLFNMLWFYSFATIFISYFDQKKLVSLYITGGLAGALLYIASYNIFPAFGDVLNISIALGASASVMAVVIAVATYVPDYTVRLFLLGTVKIKYLAIGILLLTSVFDFSVNTGGKIAHIGGAIAGYFYALSLRSGKDPGRWITVIIDKIVTWFRPSKVMRVSYKRPMNDIEYNKTKADHQKQVDRILEKISKGGYESLTSEEKSILFKESQKK